MSPSRLAEAIRRMGNIFSQFYGQSEAPMTVCTLPKRDHRPDDQHQPEPLREVVALEDLAAAAHDATMHAARLVEYSIPVQIDGLIRFLQRGLRRLDGFVHHGRPERLTIQVVGGNAHRGRVSGTILVSRCRRCVLIAPRRMVQPTDLQYGL